MLQVLARQENDIVVFLVFEVVQLPFPAHGALSAAGSDNRSVGDGEDPLLIAAQFTKDIFLASKDTIVLAACRRGIYYGSGSADDDITADAVIVYGRNIHLRSVNRRKVSINARSAETGILSCIVL